MNTLFPEVLNKNIHEHKATLDISMPKDLLYFKGHFPENPILPGIVQVHWALHYAKGCFNISGVVTRCPSIKFTNIINPEMNLKLTLEFFPTDSYITFAYKNDEHTYSTGRLCYK